MFAADQNIITEETEYSLGGSAGAAGAAGMPRVPSTAGTAAAAAAAAGAAGNAQVAAWAAADGTQVAVNGDGEDGEEPPHKRQKKGLSVHFAEGNALAQHPAGGVDGGQQQQQPAPPDG